MPDLNDNTQQEVLSDELIEVMGLLAPEKAEVPAEPEKAEPEGEEPPPEKEEATAEEQAEDAKLDYGMKVPMTDGEPVTLGELKDAYQSRQAAMLELTGRENDILRETEKAQMLLAYVADLPPHIRDAAKANAVADYQREMQLLVTIVPESKTPEGVNAMRTAIYGLAAEYGVPKRDIDQVKHAVTIKMMYDFARLKQSIRAAKDNVKPLRSADPKAAVGISKPTSELQRLTAQAQRSRNPQDEAAAVAALLRSA
jgi:hypothetical protein